MVRWIKRLVVLLLLVAVLVAAGLGVYFYPKYREYQKIADSFDLKELNEIPAISEVFDQSGQRYSRLAGEVRYVVPYQEISPLFIKALLAREDSRFEEHHGVDFSGIARAAIRNLKEGGVREGASTITQQLARNTFSLGDDKWRRKCIEALLALRIEKSIGKEEILEAYANRIYYGVGLYGVETASRACFGKSAKDLTLSEAAILAGLIRSPNRLSPLEDTRTALAQRDQVLDRMKDLKWITPEEAETARAEPMPLAKRIPPKVQENYAMDAVMRDLTTVLPEDVIDRGGLKIYTTIDRRLQMLAEDAVEAKLAAVEKEKDWQHPIRTDHVAQEGATETPYVQGAMVAIDNETGGILAIVGGRSFKESPYNRAWMAKRQIGSTFKPFVYAAAFEHGLLPGTLVDDSQLTAGDIADLTSAWSPENSDGKTEGLMPAALGLIRSRNTMTVRVGEIATRAAVRDLARRSGMENVPDLPVIYLGAFEETLKTLTAAYTMFPNGGVRRQPYVIEKIDDRHGKTIYKATHGQLRCLKPEVDYVMNELLSDVVTKGTAASASTMGLKVPSAGKTGTTDDFKDAWFVGYTSRITCGVWVGFDRPKRIAGGGYGSKLALPIWVDFIQNASSWKYEPKEFALGGDLQTTELCRTSGALATDGCRSQGTAYQVRLPAAMLPRIYCPEHGGAWASVSADSPTIPVAPAVPVGDTVSSPDVATALPAMPVQAQPTPAGNYRIIRKQDGFIFQSSP